MLKTTTAQRYFLPLIFILSGGFLFAQTVNIKIIETSDVHGALLPYDLTSNLPTTSSLAHVYSFVTEQRAHQDQEVILLDNGDLIQGDPMSYYYNFEDTISTHVFADALNFMGYDAATIGNHDIETGHAVYDKLRREINFPWMAANAVNKKNNEPYFEPYSIIERKGIRIAVLGLTTPGVPNWLPEKLWSGIRFDDMIETARMWVEIIKEKEKPDLLIGLFHSGVDYTYGRETAETYRNENAAQLVAEQVPGFDVVFVGHDHTGWNFKTKNITGNEVLVLGPLSKARTVAVATIQITFDSLTGKWEKTSSAGETVETKNYYPDDTFINRYQPQLTEVKKYVNKPLGQISKTISSQESMFGPSEFVDMIHKIQMDITNADISFTSPLTFNTTIDEGWIYVKDFFQIYHYENYLYTMALSGREIKDYLEFSYGNWMNEMKNEDDHLIRFAKDENDEIKFSSRYNTPETMERFYNYSSAAGINYTVDVSKPAGEKITIISMSDGRIFHFDSTYMVAINSYRGSGGGNHLTRGAGIPKEELQSRILSSTEKDFRYYITSWIIEKKTVTPEIISTWRVIPESWWEKGREKDYKLLFGTEAPVLERQTIEFDYK